MCSFQQHTIVEDSLEKISIKFDFINTTTEFNYNGKTIVPCLLNTHKPSEFVTSWQPYPRKDEFEIYRSIKFDFVPNGNFLFFKKEKKRSKKKDRINFLSKKERKKKMVDKRKKRNGIFSIKNTKVKNNQ